MEDPFDLRIRFLKLLKRGLDASQRSIQDAIKFIMPHFSRCGEDLWDCVTEAIGEVNINQRMNIFYFLDSLCDACLADRALPSTSGRTDVPNRSYVDFLARDLGNIVECVVPSGRAGLPNLTSVKGILENWKSKRIIDPQKVDEIISGLTKQNDHISGLPSSQSLSPGKPMSRDDIFKRIEEDRERHKRLREKRWVQPISHNPSMYRLASFMPLSEDGDEDQLALDMEFDDAWETTSDWNEDDDDAAAEENELCFPTEREASMDVT